MLPLSKNVSPREARRPLRPATSQNSCHARGLQALGKNVGQLLRCVHADQAEVAILDRLMRKMLADVDMLRTLSSTDDVVLHSMQALLSLYTGV